MGTDNKIKNKADELKGKAERAAREATDDDELERKGRRDQGGIPAAPGRREGQGRGQGRLRSVVDRTADPEG